MDIARLLLERGAQANMANNMVGISMSLQCFFSEMCLCGIYEGYVWDVWVG